MIWHKAWRESRLRFIAGAAMLSFVCWITIQDAVSPMRFAETDGPLPPYSEFVWKAIYNGPLLRMVFLMFAIVLGLGGLRRERDHGTAPFTLALPVSRLRLVSVRATLGVLQVVVLALIPAVLLPTLSPMLVQESYPFTQALQYSVLFLAWGLIWFAAGFLWSSVLGGENTALTASIVTPLIYLVVVNHPMFQPAMERFRSANPLSFMGAREMPFLNAETGLLSGLPWKTILLLGTVSAVLLVVATRVTQRQDF